MNKPDILRNSKHAYIIYCSYLKHNLKLYIKDDIGNCDILDDVRGEIKKISHKKKTTFH